MNPDDVSDSSTVGMDDEDEAIKYEIDEEDSDATEPEDDNDFDLNDDDDDVDEDNDVEDEEEDDTMDDSPFGLTGDETYFLARRPDLMTNRQRALLESKDSTNNTMDSFTYDTVDSTVFKTPEMSEEEMMKRKRRALRRRELSRDKSEKEKKLTVERLLKVSTDRKSFGSLVGGPGSSARRGRPHSSKLPQIPGHSSQRQQLKRQNLLMNQGPMIRYHSTKEGIRLSFPLSLDYPLSNTRAGEPPSVQYCSLPDCRNVKKYSCSKTGRPLCSLECYKQNLSLSVMTT